jgi:eukaryotic-like serine/threonine-protein kinase
MSLATGARLGSYEIVAVLGAGGMGEVYRARDTRLGREVAIKVILEVFASDPDRVARFQREAKVLASLNHPHIAALYGMEEADGQRFLVMELVEGQTLADRLLRGPLATGEALAIAVQIADALETAHEKGIVHRDLKPANVKLTPDDKVKVLDFGLAKAVETEGTSASAANSPTLSMMASQAGIILGTAAYMSPEQAKGFPADHRSDVFSFGSMLFEMLTGRQPFGGDTAPEILASVLVREADFSRLPPDVDPRIAELIRRCLQKHPKRRWQAIGDVRAELEAIAAAPPAPPRQTDSALRRGPVWRRAIPAVAASIVVGALAAAAAWTLKPSPAQPVVRFAIELGNGYRFSAVGRRVVTISPDGTLIAYVAEGRLYVRPIRDLESAPLPGTDVHDGVNSPTFSPDSKSLAFYAVGDGTIKRIAASGGSAVTLCPATNVMGLTWGTDGIVFGQSSAEVRQIVRVPPTGGKPQVLATVKLDEIPDSPQVLPGGDAVLLTVAKSAAAGAERWDKAQIVVQSIASGTRTVLIDGGSDGRYLPSGHIAYAIGGTVYAVPFDLRTLKVTGEAVPILEGVRRAAAASTGMADFRVSDNGTLVYIPGPASTSPELVIALFDWKGAGTAAGLPPGPYSAPRVSHDGTHVALETHDAREAFIGVYDRTGTAPLRRLTFGGNSNSPVWSPDGTRVAFQSSRDGDFAIFAQPIDGGGPPQRLTRPAAGEQHVPQSWFGDVLLFDVVTRTGTALWQLSLEDGKIAPFGNVTSSNDTGAVFSPDGRWVAYSVTADRTTDLFVQPYPATGARYMLVKTTMIAPHHPVWSAAGDLLSYVPGPALTERVPVTTRPAFTFGTPEAVNRLYQAGPPGSRRMFDQMPDGRMLGLINRGQLGSTPQHDEIRVVINWLDELRPRLPR